MPSFIVLSGLSPNVCNGRTAVIPIRCKVFIEFFFHSLYAVAIRLIDTIVLMDADAKDCLIQFLTMKLPLLCDCVRKPPRLIDTDGVSVLFELHGAADQITHPPQKDFCVISLLAHFHQGLLWEPEIKISRVIIQILLKPAD